MNLAPELLKRLNLKSAAESELSMSNRLMPRRPDRIALAGQASEVVRLFRPKYAKGQFGDLADIVFVEKNRRGRRPISEMTLRDKVLLRALVDLIAESLPAHLVTRASHDDFKKSPLVGDEVQYVSKTDVTSYYEYVDHDRLADELEAQTGEAPAIAALMELLLRVMGRRVGLPQVHRSSDILGDAYIDPVRRRMRRAGYQVTTYSDDFRIASPTLAHARQALETCAREVRQLGLTLNEAKTYTYSTPNYIASLSAFTEAEKHLFEEGSGSSEDLRLLFLDGYADEIDEGASESPQALAASTVQPVLEEDALFSTPTDEVVIDNPEQMRAAKKAWDIWVNEAESDAKQSTTDAAITETLLGRALPILGRSGVVEPVAYLSKLLRFEPALTPQISAYITELAATGPAARTKLRRTLDLLVEEQNFSVWQKVWLAEAAGNIRPAKTEYKHYAWLQECVTGQNPALAATSAAAVGRLSRGDVGKLTAALDRVGPSWRSLVIWGIAKTDLPTAESVAEDQLERVLLKTFES
ncbi:RNA-directed DNA polymerase [Paenarthrobacter sp. NPDC018779]|uniref:RNA-directed DNA polymerase n=1 Tax=Paenarthrobacter sp. NPDC018779 TaxID=3364375 RepID=UPI0037CB79EA